MLLWLLFSLIISFLTGFLVKKTDDFADRKKKKAGALQCLLAITYSLGISFLLFFTNASTIFLAGIIGVLLAKKIDHELHILGILFPLCLLIFLPLPEFSFPFFLLFSLASFLDEREFGIKNKALQQITNSRLALPACALIVSIYFGSWLYLAFIAAFDLGYRATGFCSG